ncbi:uncharacterized protein LOC62_04G006511 [Vanrija pseudolonga]|uniref:Chromo shadow domain-containing protein n=1 Tax=Vanrija pseudolonga TaxID=143232 RepID=A0AAF0YAS2_9TREE|nr:hypothetical protein LOC62_04G006511 [Vanrija pseudolonga]
MPRPNPTPYIPQAQRTISEIIDHRVTNNQLEVYCAWNELPYLSWCPANDLRDPKRGALIRAYMRSSFRPVIREGNGFKNQDAKSAPRTTPSPAIDQRVAVNRVWVSSDGEKMVQVKAVGDERLFNVSTEHAIAKFPGHYADFMFRQLVEYHMLDLDLADEAGEMESPEIEM